MKDLNVTVKEIMSTNLKVLHPKDKLIRAKELFKKYDIHHIPVTVMGKIKGIISLGDILFLDGIVNNSFDEFIRTKKYHIATIDEVMTARPYCINANDRITNALDLMIEKRINCLPVMDEGQIVGILTNFDLIKYLKNTLKAA